jgi:hypothetical protein
LGPASLTPALQTRRHKSVKEAIPPRYQGESGSEPGPVLGPLDAWSTTLSTGLVLFLLASARLAENMAQAHLPLVLASASSSESMGL